LLFDTIANFASPENTNAPGVLKISIGGVFLNMLRAEAPELLIENEDKPEGKPDLSKKPDELY